MEGTVVKVCWRERHHPALAKVKSLVKESVKVHRGADHADKVSRETAVVGASGLKTTANRKLEY